MRRSSLSGAPQSLFGLSPGDDRIGAGQKRADLFGVFLRVFPLLVGEGGQHHNPPVAGNRYDQDAVEVDVPLGKTARGREMGAVFVQDLTASCSVNARAHNPASQSDTAAVFR